MYSTKLEAPKPCSAALRSTVTDNVQTWTLSSLTDFSLPIHSPPFAVSVHTLQSALYTSSSPSPVPSCYCPADGCAAAASVDVWFHSGKVEMLLRVRNVLLLWVEETRDILHPEQNIEGHSDRTLFKFHKTGASQF